MEHPRVHHPLHVQVHRRVLHQSGSSVARPFCAVLRWHLRKRPPPNLLRPRCPTLGLNTGQMQLACPVLHSIPPNHGIIRVVVRPELVRDVSSSFCPLLCTLSHFLALLLRSPIHRRTQSLRQAPPQRHILGRLFSSPIHCYLPVLRTIPELAFPL